MNYDQFTGLDDLIGPLQREFSEGRYVHAYLFSGPAGTGKRTAAEICARAVHCAGAGTVKPCDACPPCNRMMAGTYPDHVVLSASGRSIGVDEVRDLIQRVSIKPFEGGRHTVIIVRAEKLTAQAQNALLKTLETPPGGAVFFLLTTSPSQLLPTIVSRCRLERFHPVPVAEAERALIRTGAPSDRAALAAASSSGAIGRAMEQLQDAGYWSLRGRVVESLRALKGPWAVAEAAQKLAGDKDNASQTLEVIESLARDMLLASAGLESGRTGAETGDIPVDGETLLACALAARQKLNSNVSWQTVLEMMYFDSLKGSIPWQQ
jgi:DNA polymerase-3 subunit delta'